MSEVYHFTGIIERGRALPDGNTDATLFELVVDDPGLAYIIPHGLGRAVNQVQVVKANRTIGIPVWATDVQGRDINDAEKIGLIFTNILDEAPVTVRLRFA